MIKSICILALSVISIQCGTELKLLLARAQEGIQMNNSGWSDKNHTCEVYLLCSSEKTIVECSFDFKGIPDSLQNEEIPVQLHSHACNQDPNPQYKNNISEVRTLESNELWVKTKLNNGTDDEAIGTAEYFVRTKSGQRPGSIVVNNPHSHKPALCYNLYYYNKEKQAKQYCSDALSAFLQQQEVQYQYIDYSQLYSPVLSAFVMTLLVILF